MKKILTFSIFMFIAADNPIILWDENETSEKELDEEFLTLVKFAKGTSIHRTKKLHPKKTSSQKKNK